MIEIDLNADLGEGFGRWTLGDDEALLEVVTSASIACGFHAGDPQTMDRATKSAASRSVIIGAHVGYRDLVGFGRRHMVVTEAELRSDVLYQIGALQGFCQQAGTTVAYVKPHGALYNQCAIDAEQAETLAKAIFAYNPDLALLGPPGSELLKAAANVGLKGVAEAFADRAYAADGRLVERSKANSVFKDEAVLTDESAVVAQAKKIALQGQVVSLQGQTINLKAQTLCIHGDTARAPHLAKAARAGLENAGVKVAAFA